MPSSLSKYGGLTLFVTHENHSMSLVLFVPVFLFRIKKSKVRKFTKTRTRDHHNYSHVRYPWAKASLNIERTFVKIYFALRYPYYGNKYL